MQNLKQTIQEEVDKYFGGDQYRYFIFIRTYSRFLDNEMRRETWTEVVQRFVDFMKESLGEKLSESEYSEIQNAILFQEIMPSMRLLWASGDAVRKNNASAFNCTYTAIDNLDRFKEILFLLTSGCGVGFSVESHVVDKLPEVETQFRPAAGAGWMNPIETFVVPDSREGWADALDVGVKAWFNGDDVAFDYSQIRPLGARLKTFGGRASGPEPLQNLLDFTRSIILNAQGRKLRPIEVHDICTKIAEIVVAGGTRRSSEISLSDLDDEEMRNAKFGNFFEDPKIKHRVMANNSVAYKSKPSQEEFIQEWLSLVKSHSGERGIYNREGTLKQMPERRQEVTTEEIAASMGLNPCAEINLRSNEMCNLTSVVCRADDDEANLSRKVRLATILGTYQSTLTNFIYLSPIWKDNCDQERLLGVSLNGQFDCPTVREPHVLQNLKGIALATNKDFSHRFNINESVAITCTKPEGTGSQMLNCSSGAHPRYAQFYIRRVRIAKSDPLFTMMRDQGVPFKHDNNTTMVMEFPIAAPAVSITRNDISAIEQLEHWKVVKSNYAEHTVSMTVYVGVDEWIRVANWVWDNWDLVGGISFLPKEDENHVYKLAPYEEIDETKYKELSSEFPKIDYSQLSIYELEDQTQGAKEAACASGACELI